MSEKIKGMFGSKTRADEVLAWLKSQGAKTSLYDGSLEQCIYYVDQEHIKIVEKGHSCLFDIVELPRWRAIKAGVYFYINDRGRVDSTLDTYELDADRYKCGNYFQTKEEAETYVEKFREIFKRKEAE